MHSHDRRESRCPCGCNEWITDWWMPPAVIGTETDPESEATTTVDERTASVDRATTTVDRRTTTVDPSTKTVGLSTGRVDRSTATGDVSTKALVRRTAGVDRATTTVAERTATGARRPFAQVLRDGLELRPAGTGAGACLSALMDELRSREHLPPPFSPPLAHTPPESRTAGKEGGREPSWIAREQSTARQLRPCITGRVATDPERPGSQSKGVSP